MGHVVGLQSAANSTSPLSTSSVLPPSRCWRSLAATNRHRQPRQWAHGVLRSEALAETLSPVTLTQTQQSVEVLKQTRLITAIKTPYREDGKFDLRAYDAHVVAQIENGVEGLIVGGTTGAPSTWQQLDTPAKPKAAKPKCQAYVSMSHWLCRPVRCWPTAPARLLLPSDTPCIVFAGEGQLMSWDEHVMLIAHTVNSFGNQLQVIGNTGSNSTREALHATEQGFAVGMHAALQINPYYGKTSLDGLMAHFSAVIREGPTIIYNVPSRTGLSAALLILNALTATQEDAVCCKGCLLQVLRFPCCNELAVHG